MLSRLIMAAAIRRAGVVQFNLPAKLISLREFSSSGAASNGAPGDDQSMLPSWMRSRLPAALGGNREEIKELESLTLDGELFADGRGSAGSSPPPPLTTTTCTPN